MKLTRLDQMLDDAKDTKGRWELTPNHEVQYKSDKKDEEFKFKGSIIAAEPDALVISLTERQSDQKVVTRIAKLGGAWRLDPKNRIVFEVEKESGKNDVLTFKGTWQVGPNQEILYTYDLTNLKTRKKTLQKLVFQGYWDISEDHRLTYWFSGDSNSAFRFRGAFQTKSIIAKKGEIRYQAGVEIGGKHKIQTIALFGKWKLSRSLELAFEIEYEDGQKKAITFGGEYHLDGGRQIIVNLKNKEGDPLGIEVILTKDIFGKDGQAFVRLAKSVEESRIEAGVNFRW
ncbi:MAG: hypothetical protein ACRENF_04225 [Thermodesulfobacteriota bacterium]